MLNDTPCFLAVDIPLNHVWHYLHRCFGTEAQSDHARLQTWHLTTIEQEPRADQTPWT